MPSKFKGLKINDTGAITLPSGTTAQQISYTEQVVEFTTAGATTWTVPSGVNEVEVLVVAGGGGGGSGLASGGGAGGVLYEPNYKVIPGENVYVFVGAGGAGGADNTNNPGSNGQNSKFGSLEAIGGGGGGAEASDNGSSGGSGGGSSSTNPRLEIREQANNGQGHAGGVTEYGADFGYVHGSGGGAGGPGTIGTKGNFSLPGPGLQFNITGSPKWYGGGGAGAAYGDAIAAGKGAGLDGALGGGGNGGLSGNSTNARLAGDATSNTGGGGGGGPEGITAEGGGNHPGGNGGSGVIVVRYYQDSDSESPYGHIRNNSATNTIEVFRSGYWKTNDDIVTDGLRLRADAENYNYGNTWEDTSGNNNDITLYNAPTKRNGNIPSIYFDENSSQYWDTALVDVGQPNTSFTAAGWAKFIATGPKDGNYMLMSTYTTASNSPFWAIMINYNGGNVYGWARGQGSTPSVQMQPYSTIEPGKWYYYAFVRDHTNNAVALYINGNQVQAEIFPGSADLNDSDEPFGGIKHSTASFMSAEMGAVHLYSRALDSVEVRQNFEAEKTKYGIERARTYAKASVKSDIPQNGLVFHLDANNPASFPDPSRNSVWLDLVDSKEVRLDGPQWDITSGNIKYLDFDGTNDTGIMPGVITSYPLTASFWCTHNSGFSPGAGEQDEIMNFSIGGQRLSLGCTNGLSAGWSQIGLTIMYGGTNHWTAPRNGPVAVTSSTQFYNITYVVHGSNDRNHNIYVNGISLPMTNEGGGHGGSAGASLGSNGSGGEFWPGKIAKVMLYNRVLSSNEINQIYQSTRWRFGG